MTEHDPRIDERLRALLDSEGALCWGYARSSTDRQIFSPERQDEDIRRRAEQLEQEDGTQLGSVLKDSDSAELHSFEDRKPFRWLMSHMRNGDTLIVWRLDRIDRNPFRMLHAIEFMVKNNIRLIVLKERGGIPLDLNSAGGRAMLLLLCMFADMEAEYRKEAIAGTRKWLKDQGLPYSSRVPWGKRRTKVPSKRPGRKQELLDVWDDKEVAQILEIVRRMRAGETPIQITADFGRRGLLRACGVKWATKASRGPRRNVSWNTLRIRQVYKWAEEELEKEGSINGKTVD